MEWFIALFIIHLASLAACRHLYPGSPDWMQRLILVGIGFGTVLLAAGYLVQAFEHWAGWTLVAIGLGIEHAAVLLYLFRLVWQKHHQPESESAWATSSAHSPSLSR